MYILQVLLLINLICHVVVYIHSEKLTTYESNRSIQSKDTLEKATKRIDPVRKISRMKHDYYRRGFNSARKEIIKELIPTYERLGLIIA